MSIQKGLLNTRDVRPPGVTPGAELSYLATNTNPYKKRLPLQAHYQKRVVTKQEPCVLVRLHLKNLKFGLTCKQGFCRRTTGAAASRGQLSQKRFCEIRVWMK